MKIHGSFPRWLRRLTALVLSAAIGVTLTPAHARAKAGHADCGRSSGATTSHHPGMQAHGGHEPATELQAGAAIEGAPASCDHCPADRCAITAPCGGSTTQLSVSHAFTVPVPYHGSAAIALWHPAHSRSSRPPTPPPTRLL